MAFYVQFLGRADTLGRDKPVRFGRHYEGGWCFATPEPGRPTSRSEFATKKDADTKASAILGDEVGVWEVRELEPPAPPYTPSPQEQLKDAVGRSIEKWPHDRETMIARAMGHGHARRAYTEWLLALATFIRELPDNDSLLEAFQLAGAPIPYRPVHGSQQHEALNDRGVYPPPEQAWRALVEAAQRDYENRTAGEPLLEQLQDAIERREAVAARRAALDALLTEPATP